MKCRDENLITDNGTRIPIRCDTNGNFEAPANASWPVKSFTYLGVVDELKSFVVASVLHHVVLFDRRGAYSHQVGVERRCWHRVVAFHRRSTDRPYCGLDKRPIGMAHHFKDRSPFSNVVVHFALVFHIVILPYTEGFALTWCTRLELAVYSCQLRSWRGGVNVHGLSWKRGDESCCGRCCGQRDVWRSWEVVAITRLDAL